jgi:hypothetical protein
MRSLRIGLALVMVVGLGGCATSKIESAWAEPTATPESFASMKQVLVVAMVSDGAIRRASEDAMDVAVSSGPRGQSGDLVVHPSYTLLDDKDLGNREAARKKVEAAGYDGAVLMSYVSSQQKVTVTPPTYSGGFWGGYGRYGYGGGAMIYDPGSVRTDTILKLQVSIYSLKEEKLLWSGVSRTLNPSDVQKLIGDVTQAMADDLRKRGLLP